MEININNNEKYRDIDKVEFPYAVKFCINCRDMELVKMVRGKWICQKCKREVKDEK